jgi:nicotinamide phosphoribosyltransferase
MSKEFIYPATLLCDFYKISHKDQYPQGTEIIYSTWTPRMSRIEGADKKLVDLVIAFGFQAFIKEYLMDYFTKNFFSRPTEDVVAEYKRVIQYTLGITNPDASHIQALHELGYLPLRIKAVKEGTHIPLRCPMLTVENTKPEFFWLTNYIETLMSCVMWQPTTSATIANEYRKMLDSYAEKTGGDLGGVQFQGHDFSMRGMSSLDSAKASGAGHLLSFSGTDTIPAILYLEEFYNADITKELVGTSIPATEHSVMCAYGQDELESYRRIITEVYPSGFASIVSDTWDLWSVLYDVIGKLKPEIMARDGKIVVRPDSGDPVDIICGSIQPIEDKQLTLDNIVEWFNDESSTYFNENCDGDGYVDEKSYTCKIDGKYYRVDCHANFISERGGYSDSKYYTLDDVEISYIEIERTSEQKGVIEILWEIFGGTITAKGFKQLDSHIGCIYGDAITIDRCRQINERLMAKGFASTNMVYGIGSFTYQYNTRDTFGFALKSTFAQINGVTKNLFKDPVTDKANFKKSQTGLVVVTEQEGKITYVDGLTLEQRDAMRLVDLLEDVFIDGQLLRNETLAEIRAKVNE